jgi:hypothetical protein
LPNDWRGKIYNTILDAVPAGWLDETKTEYVAKALSYQDTAARQDIDTIVGILGDLKSGGKHVRVISNLHAVKFSRANSYVSYEDKRGATTSLRFGKNLRETNVPYWYLSYQEISAALDSGELEPVQKMAVKYQCNYFISKHKFNDDSLEEVYIGTAYHLYRYDAWFPRNRSEQKLFLKDR